MLFHLCYPLFWRRKWQPTPRIPMDRGAWQATVYGVTRVRHDLVTKPPPPPPSPLLSLPH